ncbi:Cyclin-dependent kinase 11B isoform 1 [Schistosoma japonicum]|uniref:cyclin-dependent kinase n=2 Tax=Schistosoma japonicum TaxID=6182 RepID=A0A4Z2CU45_SCHJA|nr:Cyclin-dependent kinase 11B isoform 1 [Schistosoma japonicum]
MDFLVEIDDELDYNESESPVTLKRTSTNYTDLKSAQSHIKLVYASDKSRRTISSPREEGEAYSDEENDSGMPLVESKLEYNSRQMAHFDKEEGEASSEEDRRYEDSRREKLGSSKYPPGNANLSLEENQYRSRLHERYKRREHEKKRVRDNMDSESVHRPHQHERQICYKDNSSSSERDDIRSNVKVEDPEACRKYQSSNQLDPKQKDRLLTSTMQQTLEKSPQDNRQFKTVRTEHGEFILRCSENQSSSVIMTDRIVESQTIYTDELNPQSEVNRKSKSKKSKRDRKEKEKGSSKSTEIIFKTKKESKQRKVQPTGGQLDYNTWESLQKYTKLSDRHHAPLLHSRSGSLDSISSTSSQLSKVSAYSDASSHSSAILYRKSASASGQQLQRSQSPHDRDEAYNYSKKRYHREARETAPPPESTRHYTGPNQISIKIKHKRKADKRETSVNNNYGTDLPSKREKPSQGSENREIQIEDSHKHSTSRHSKSKLLKTVEADSGKHKKRSSKNSKMKSSRKLSSTSKLHEDYEQDSHNLHRSAVIKPSVRQYLEESDSDPHSINENISSRQSIHEDSYNKVANVDVNEKSSGKSKEIPLLFPSGNKINVEEMKSEFNRLPPPPRYPGYSESSSECDESGVPDNEFLNEDVNIPKLDDNNKYNEFRKDIVNEDEINSFKAKPPGKPFYFPSIQGCRSVEEFECLNRIEEGTYGVVYRARDKKVNEIVALKRLKMEKERDGFPITSLREINMLMKAQHENIVTVREVVVGSNMDKIYLVMDYVEHDLKSLMEIMNGPFSVGEVKCLLVQLLRAVSHLHDNWILHRDLKTSNLLLSHQGILKVGDFGLAREYGSPLKHYTEVVVTLWYRAPELLLGTKQYTCPIDLWSVGCIFAEFLLQRPLFPGKGEVDELNIIFRDLGTPTERIWPGVSQLPGIKKCVFTEYPYNQLRRRFTEKQISDQGFDLLNSFLTYCPDKRITAEKALVHPYFNERPRAIHPSMFPSWPAKSEGGVNVKRASPRAPAGGGALAAAAAAVAAAAAAAAASSSVTSVGGGGSRMRYQPPAPPMGGQRFYSTMSDSRPGTANQGTCGSGETFTTSGVDKGFLLRF